MNEYAWGPPICGCPMRLNTTRSIALASVTVPTVERTFAPIRSWSRMIAVVSPSRESTSGLASVGMKPWTKALYVSLISRCDFGRDRAEHEGALARPGDPGERREAPLRDVEADVAEVVLAGAADLDGAPVAVQGQPPAFLTSSAICFSTAGVSFATANETGHISPSSRAASGWNSNDAYRTLNFDLGLKKQMTLPSLA